MSDRDVPDALFDLTVPPDDWSEFRAVGFAGSVSGIVHRLGKAPCCGVPVGGVSTGCLDVETSGVIGFSTLFNPFPRKPQLLAPFLGLNVGGRTTVLATRQMVDGGEFQSCTEPVADPTYWRVTRPRIDGVGAAKEIHYWGHFPVADLEYETELPVAVGLRAWAPFVVGDLDASKMPALAFEVHLRNESRRPDRNARGQLSRTRRRRGARAPVRAGRCGRGFASGNRRHVVC